MADRVLSRGEVLEGQVITGDKIFLGSLRGLRNCTLVNCTLVEGEERKVKAERPVIDGCLFLNGVLTEAEALEIATNARGAGHLAGSRTTRG